MRCQDVREGSVSGLLWVAQEEIRCRAERELPSLLKGSHQRAKADSDSADRPTPPDP